LHRLRRAPLNPFFSKQRVTKLQGLVWDLSDKLCARFEEYRGTGKPVLIRSAYSCLSTDTITTYAFDRCWNLLDDKEFAPWWNKSVAALAESGLYMRHVPWLIRIVNKMPLSLIRVLSRDFATIMQYNLHVRLSHP